MRDLTASIVLYKNPPGVLARTIHSFLESTKDSILYLIDNSPTDALKYLAYDHRIVYIFNNKNTGFSAGHNVAIRKIMDTSNYHLVLNPDVYFDTSVLSELYQFMEGNPLIGQVMPRVLYPDGRLQHLCKLLPTPKTLIMRRFFGFFHKSLKRENQVYELRSFGYDKILDVPFLSGCFMFLRVEALKKVGLFDERFFLYTEDTDLTRRIHQHYRTVYYPNTTIYHHHARGSYKELGLLWCNIVSAIKYFNKWGWALDEERERINRRTLLQVEQIMS
jgi:GT2 family glycosyltransferase